MERDIKYPLSFAVFYQSIIKNCSSYNQYLTVHALLFGEIIDRDTFTEKISAGTISEYVKAKRQLRQERVEDICSKPVSELAEYIRCIDIQDISYVVDAIKRLLAITDLSNDLKKELIEKADMYGNKLEYIAEIYQLSVKVFRKLDLGDKQIGELEAIWSGETENTGIENDDAKQNSETKGFSGGIKFRAGFVDEINEILQKEGEHRSNSLFFYGGSVEYYDVSLPDDYDSLMLFLASFFDKQDTSQISYEDVISVTGQFPGERVLRDRKLSLFRASGDFDFCKKVVQDLFTKKIGCSVRIKVRVGKAVNKKIIYDLLREGDLYFTNIGSLSDIIFDNELPEKFVMLYIIFLDFNHYEEWSGFYFE